MKKIMIAVIVLILIIIGIVATQKNKESVTETDANVEMNLAEQDFVGLTPDQAVTKSKAENIPFRVVTIDGQPQPTTRDFREGRVNAEVTEGIITSYIIEANIVASPEDNQVAEEQGGLEQQEETGGQDGLYPNLIGLTVEEAQNFTEAEDVPFRIGSVDGELRPVTLDYRIGRITAAVENNIVTDYSVEQ